MRFNRTPVAGAVLLAMSTMAFAQTTDESITKVVVTANPIRAAEGDQILTPAKVLAGDELRDKLGGSLGETLSRELGVSASAFGPGSSRPIIRGLEGSRVKMLENGMAVADVSGLSNDHAVSAEGATAAQIEILRGPASLLYGSGAIGGLVNVVNERIPAALESEPSASIEARHSSVDKGRHLSGTADAAIGNIALHFDGSTRRTDDYRIPGSRVPGDPDSGSGRLPHSATDSRSAGLGASLVGDWGHLGASVSTLDNLYGVPSEEGAQIDLRQARYDIEGVRHAPLPGIETLRAKVGHTDYEHAELEDGAPAVIFKNRSTETRVELSHKPLAGWRGTFGVQTENTHFSGLAAEGGEHEEHEEHDEHDDEHHDHEHGNTVPVTRSTSAAAFVVEETDVGPVRLNAGVRLETVKRRPVDNLERKFNLASYSIGGMWPFRPGYSAGATVSVAQRAPATEELYSRGAHHATLTFDVGNPNFRKETSRNVELSLMKNSGLVQWKANLFHNSVHDFIYGHVTGRVVDGDGHEDDHGELRERLFEQADATLYGAEAEITLNKHRNGLSGRLFADTSRGKLDRGGNLPLQPATRLGAEIGYRAGPLRAGLSLVHGLAQDRLASFEESTTPSYNQLNANLSYTQRFNGYDLAWFAVAKNLMNEEIRLSTSLLKDISPLPGRNIVLGVRAKF